MALSEYHRNYRARSDEELFRRSAMKERELARVFGSVPFVPVVSPVKVAVLGCADVRFVPAHRAIFKRLTGKPVELTTFDITVEHLAGEEGVIRHDLTEPLPGGPYDIAFGHVVLKFIEAGKQWDVLRNSYDVLRTGGLAIHVFDDEEVAAETARISRGGYAVPLKILKDRLSEAGIPFTDLRWDMKIDDGGEPLLARGLKGGALVLRKKELA